MTQTIGIPSIPTALTLFNNTALAYGDDFATTPKELVVLRDLSSGMIPGIHVLDASLELRDSFEQLVKGTEELPVPYLLESWACSARSCPIQQSLMSPLFLSFESESGVSNTAMSESTIKCSPNTPNVTVTLSLFGSSSPLLSKTLQVQCLRCGNSQVRVNEVGKIKSWFCSHCNAGQYIIDSDLYKCQNCPVGAQIAPSNCTILHISPEIGLNNPNCRYLIVV
jgi:hypothetical protein